MNRKICIFTLILGAFLTVSLLEAAEKYQPTWDSLKDYKHPEWFLDAKLGIYTHWGPITVATENAPSGMEWYAKQLYMEEHKAFAYHKEKYGDQTTVGYKDIIPMFKAEKFNADEWADLFQKAGAKFAGPVAIHHDNYALWDSAHTRWDSMDVGPKRDFTGELSKAIKKRNMKFIATFHHSFSWKYYEQSYKYDAKDGKNADLYGEPHKPGEKPSQRFLDVWLKLINEVVTKYEPELIWFDFGLGSVIPPASQQRMFADYYNWADKKSLSVGVAHKHWNIHKHTGIIDFERGRMDKKTHYPWLTDTSVGPWFHHNSLGFKNVNQLIDVLVDIVSKNGCMLLNVGPKADGSIPAEGKKVLLELGAWLRINGEAIYNTRTWDAYGEGPTKMKKSGGFSEHHDKAFTNKDIRFTRSKNGKTIYAIALEWPSKDLLIKSMKIGKGNDATKVELLGYNGDISYSVNDKRQLVLNTSKIKKTDLACQHAFAFALHNFDIKLNPNTSSPLAETIKLRPDKATLEGTEISANETSIGYWNNPNDRIHWLIKVPHAGTWAVNGEFSTGSGASSLKLSVNGTSDRKHIPSTGNWDKHIMVNFNNFKVSKPGVHKVTLEPTNTNKWNPVNVYQIQLAPIR